MEKVCFTLSSAVLFVIFITIFVTIVYKIYKFLNNFYDKLKQDITNQIKNEVKDIFSAQVKSIDEKIRNLQVNRNAQQPRYFQGYGIAQQPTCNFECCNKKD